MKKRVESHNFENIGEKEREKERERERERKRKREREREREREKKRDTERTKRDGERVRFFFNKAHYAELNYAFVPTSRCSEFKKKVSTSVSSHGFTCICQKLCVDIINLR